VSRWVARLVGWSAANPARALAAMLALTAVGLVVAVLRFQITTDTAELISPKVQWRQDEATLTRAFPQNSDLTVVVIDGATPELAEDAAARLSARLATETKTIATVRRPDGGDYFAREGLMLQSLDQVKSATSALISAQGFLGPLAADPSLRGVMTALQTLGQGVSSGATTLGAVDKPVKSLADALEKAARGQPAFFSWQALVSDGGGLSAPSRRFVLVQPKLVYGSLSPGGAAADVIRADAHALGLTPINGATVRLTGSVPLSDEEFASLADKVWLVTGSMLLAVLVCLWLAVRSKRMVAAILATTIAGLIVTSALGLLAVGRFNLISVAFIPLFVGLGIDFGIQIGVRFNAERKADAADLAGALRRAAAGVGGSLALAAAAVTLGFFAFLPTSYVGVSELGIIAGLGMIVGLLFNLTMLPALLVLVRPRSQAGEVGTPAMAPADRFMHERRKVVLGAFVGATVVSLALLPFVRFDFNPFHLRNPHGEAMRALADLMADPNETPNTVDALAPSIPAAQALARRMEALPPVQQAITVASFVPDDQPAKLAVIQDAQSLLDPTLNPFDVQPAPTDAEVVASLQTTAQALRAAASGQGGAPADDARRLASALQALATGPKAHRDAAAAMLVKPLNVMLTQSRQMLAAQPVTLADLPPDLVRDWVAKDGQARVSVFPKGDSNDNATLVRFAKAVRTIAPRASGAPISIQEAGKTISQAFVVAGLLSFVAVSLLLFAVLRDVKEVGFTLAPIVLSIFLTLGTCVVVRLPINFANIIAFPLLVGVGTAFHIYFVMAWRQGQSNLLQSPLARAVFFSALTTGAAFGSLMFSSHPGTASMGELLMLSLVWTLVCALLFEPALLGPPRAAARGEA
jgi:uncharacterized protein